MLRTSDEPQPGRYAIRPDSLAQSVVILLTMTLVQRFVGFGRSILFCRWLSPNELGHWDLTLAFLDLAAPIAILSLPACFGRYVEHYRQRGHLRVFLERTVLAVVLLLALSLGGIYLARSWFAGQIYRSGENVGLVLLVLAALPCVILCNTLSELFSGLRMYRMVSGIQFFQSLLFASLGAGLVLWWKPGAGSIILAYGAACLLCSLLPLYWLARMWWVLPASSEPLPQTQLWRKLLPFALAVWISNFLGNAFVFVDRYMIMHFSGMRPEVAEATVGQYHSARVVPILVVSIASLIGTMIVPFLSHDWEAGRRASVSARLNSFLKAAGLGLTGLGALVLLASPMLFGWVYANKFSAGQSVLPFTLMCATWFGMTCIARTYLWCDERVWLVSVALLMGIGVNILCGLVLLPRLGLLGAVLSASAANVTALLAVYGLACWRGMRVSPGTWIVSAAPLALCLGPWVCLAFLSALVLFSATHQVVFEAEEKSQLAEMARGYLDRMRSRWSRWRVAAGAADS